MSFNKESEEGVFGELEANLGLCRLPDDEDKDSEEGEKLRANYRHGVGYQEVVLTAEQIKLKDRIEKRRGFKGKREEKKRRDDDAKEKEEEDESDEEFSRVGTILESIKSRKSAREEKVAKRLKV
ncbi:hypothetical protein BEWA_012700 [Theileria equi strain WA]|uniref:Uncharacterized protein n=1 Tax=Theileria equi strain WA TaxID=1537102 RepID=L1LBK0_THEEQ|nr:hypothetical protein BEWA_012700 [Theileria equi strain WA]EKX72711.1 hypothetical protein BEWA_012700 [Theileria equi strain WA]|eukprot:XP_004832163.1 hypothetical protein BEWA_012700 [Theileria equi strain WA]